MRTQKLIWLSSGMVLGAAVTALLCSMIGPAGWADVPAWVQAFGSIGAIGGAFAVVQYQARVRDRALAVGLTIAYWPELADVKAHLEQAEPHLEEIIKGLDDGSQMMMSPLTIPIPPNLEKCVPDATSLGAIGAALIQFIAMLRIYNQAEERARKSVNARSGAKAKERVSNLLTYIRSIRGRFGEFESDFDRLHDEIVRSLKGPAGDLDE